MKKRQKIWIVVLLTLLVAAAVFFALFGSGGKDDAPQTGNLIVNGDFALTTDGEPDGWQTGAWVTSAGASYLEAVTLEDGTTAPAIVNLRDYDHERGFTLFDITIHEGRNRQIRRMCSAVGLQVVRLRRSAEGPVKLGMLQPGEYRELKKSEINALRNAAMKSAGKGESRAASPARRPGPLKKRTNSD